MRQPNFISICRAGWEKVMRSEIGDMFWIESSWKSQLFVGYVPLFSGKTATTLKSSALVAYPVRVELIYVSLKA